MSWVDNPDNPVHTCLTAADRLPPDAGSPGRADMRRGTGLLEPAQNPSLRPTAIVQGGTWHATV